MSWHKQFAHLFQDQIRHRGQVYAMLAGTSSKPPQLDEFFCADEAKLRESLVSLNKRSGGINRKRFVAIAEMNPV